MYKVLWKNVTWENKHTLFDFECHSSNVEQVLHANKICDAKPAVLCMRQHSSFNEQRQMVAVLPICTFANTGAETKRNTDVFRTRSNTCDGAWRYNTKRKVRTKHNTYQLTLCVPFIINTYQPHLWGAFCNNSRIS